MAERSGATGGDQGGGKILLLTLLGRRAKFLPVNQLEPGITLGHPCFVGGGGAVVDGAMVGGNNDANDKRRLPQKGSWDHLVAANIMQVNY